ncbi:MAG TPA: (d)CMP kinase [Polyangiaceae bacterium]|jgi:cytidylate kinase
MKRPVVAIDGPAGAGKTTVTRRVAERLGYLLVDTGALYRAVALAAVRLGVDWSDETAVGKLAHDLAERSSIRMEPDARRGQRILLEGEDISDAIRTQQIAEGASRVSAIASVRAALLDLQRAAGSSGAVVLEGRDIGTVVFPNAQAKFFLTASVEVRARRRLAELTARGISADPSAVLREVVERDQRDSTRAVAPLRRAPDAALVDSSQLSVEEVADQIVEKVRRVEQEMRSAHGTGGER